MTTPLSGGNNPNNQNVTIPAATLQAMQDDIDYLKEAVQVLSNGIVSLTRCHKSLENNLCVKELIEKINGTGTKHKNSSALKSSIITQIKKP